MKVLHLVAGELTGGAARGAYWLHQGLRSLGVDSRVYTLLLVFLSLMYTTRLGYFKTLSLFSRRAHLKEGDHHPLHNHRAKDLDFSLFVVDADGGGGKNL